VPLALTLSSPPTAPRQPRLRPTWLWRISPAAVLGSAGSGLANGAFWALGPVYATAGGRPVSQVALFMSCAVLGGALAQWPIGKWSDFIDRRRVLMIITLTASLLGLLLCLASGNWVYAQLVLAFLFGASALPVYSISLAHANDHATAAESVDVSSNLLLIFATAAIAGPVFGSLFSGGVGAGGLFLYTALVHLGLAGFIYLRMRARGPVPPEERDAYVAMPQKSSVQLYELDPRSAPETKEEQPGANSPPLLVSPELGGTAEPAKRSGPDVADERGEDGVKP
jgi:MFS family permease